MQSDLDDRIDKLIEQKLDAKIEKKLYIMRTKFQSDNDDTLDKIKDLNYKVSNIIEITKNDV